MGNASAGVTSFRGYVRELDSIRAVGSLIVMAYHFWPATHRLARCYDALSMVGWMAMDAFFVMSGFLIAGILLDSREKPHYFQTFYARRGLRILPVYYVVLSLMTLGLCFVDHGSGYRIFTTQWGSPFWFFCYLGNVVISLRGFGPDKTFGPLWSLQVEEQFYLTLPLIIHVCNRRTLSRVLWSLVVISPLVRAIWALCDPMIRWTRCDQDTCAGLYTLLPCRMEGLALGALIALRFRGGVWDLPRRRLTVFTVISLSATLVIAKLGGVHWYSPFNRTVGLLLSPLACALLVLWLICFRGTRWTSPARVPGLAHLARISYATYLLHMPVGNVVKLMLTPHWKGYSHSFLAMGLCIAATIVLATLSWFFLEKPILSLKDRFTVTRSRLKNYATAGSAA